ncbi:DNA polymerase IV [Pseudonocardia sp. KRD291]|uniref:DNA polymerase IV n=1 Tax=Pseudonocardia sp. KRD291 TaxID=2792007 RepID=UPI001C4A0B3A|nr:DNA polymerase IV [Pseudonocardia sp. KRD291]MBW0102364.1 DNA polymerase IV [Pseudonocardia sp. KRD291]
MSRWILHVDLDQFIAAVEILRRPELAGRPVVVGGTGSPDERAVVATASYEAREHGVGSGTPMRLARRKLPDAVFLPSDTDAYQLASDEVMDVLRATGEPVEVIGWDEAFVGTDADPRALADRIRRDVAKHTRLSCAVGIGDNTLRAKTATGFGKPGGVFELTARNWFATMGDRDPEALPGIGRRTARKLAELGLTTVTALAQARPGDVAARLGPRMGPYCVSLGRGMGRTELETGRYIPRSRSRETTFGQNIDDPERLRAEVTTLAHQVAADVAEEDRDVARVGLKVRLAPFRTHTRSAAITAPGRDGDAIAGVAIELLEAMAPDRPVRLLGVRAEFAAPADHPHGGRA